MSYRVLPLEIVSHIFAYDELLPFNLYPEVNISCPASAFYIVRRTNGAAGLVKVENTYFPLYSKADNGQFTIKIFTWATVCTLGAQSAEIVNYKYDLNIMNRYSIYSSHLINFVIDITNDSRSLEIVNQFTKLVERKNTKVPTRYYYRYTFPGYLRILQEIVLQKQFPQHHKFFVAYKHQSGSIADALLEATKLKSISANAVYTVLELDARLNLQNSEVDTKACSTDFVYLFTKRVDNSTTVFHIPKCEALSSSDYSLITRCNFPHGLPNLIFMEGVGSFCGVVMLLKFCITQQIPNLLIGTGTWSGTLDLQSDQCISGINEELRKGKSMQLHLFAVDKATQKEIKSKIHFLKYTIPQLRISFVKTRSECFSTKAFPFFGNY